jgi:hypothetical protein
MYILCACSAWQGDECDCCADQQSVMTASFAPHKSRSSCLHMSPSLTLPLPTPTQPTRLLWHVATCYHVSNWRCLTCGLSSFVTYASAASVLMAPCVATASRIASRTSMGMRFEFPATRHTALLRSRSSHTAAPCSIMRCCTYLQQMQLALIVSDTSPTS